MKDTYSIYYKSIVIILLLVLIVRPVKSQGIENVKIKFSSTKLSLKKALDELNALPEINIVYSNSEDYSKINIQFHSNTTTVKEAFKIIQEQAPIDIVLNNNHIIVKKRKLKESYQLKGVVKDAEKKEPLVAASVFIIETNKRFATDENGNFSLLMKPGNYKVDISYMGYKVKQLEVNLFEDINLQVIIEEIRHEIKVVEVIGVLGKTEDLERGRSIEKIEAKTVNHLNTNDVNDALLGRINGVWSTKVSGAPGDHSKIRIRGISSILGSTDPLYVVDGVIIPIVNLNSLGIADLNTHDVANITILKDASSTALYGNLGGNGVILIETKEGGGEETTFNFNFKKGMQWLSKRYDLMNNEDFLATKDLSDQNFGTYFKRKDVFHRTLRKFPEHIDNEGNVMEADDFQEELFQRGDITEYQLSGKGGNKIVDFYLSGNYYTHKGIITNTQYDKYSATANLSRDFGKKLKLHLLYKGAVQKNKNNLDNYMGNSVIYKGINYEPGYRYTSELLLSQKNRLFNLGSNLINTELVGSTIIKLTDTKNSPDSLFYGQSKRKNQTSNAFNFHGTYQINSDLSIHAGLSLSYVDMVYRSYIPQIGDDVMRKYLSTDENVVIFNQQYDLRYDKQINNHSISGFFRFRNYNDNVYWELDSSFNVELEGLKPEEDIYMRGSQAIFGEKGAVIRSITSNILNLNYMYKKKYSVSAIANYEHLNEGQYVDHSGLFYSLAVDYDLAQEPILRIPQWINAFHLNANVGRVGNYPLNSLSNDLFSQREYAANTQTTNAAFYDNLANHHLKHEEITEYNYGTEIGLFRNRIILTGLYYMKYCKGLILKRSIPIYYLGGQLYQNIGEIESKGIELSMEITPIEGPNFNWTTKFGYASNHQVITKLYDGQPISFNDPDEFYPDFYARENEPIGNITGYSFQGVWDDKKYTDPASINKYVNHMGMAYLKVDTLNPTKLTTKDKTVIGNSIPKFTCNWINIIKYKNFTCEMLWYGVLGFDKFNATKACTYITGTNSEVNQLIADTMKFFTEKAVYESSYFVEDASFIRLKTLSFRYQQPKKFWGKVGAEYSISFENLVTLTKYSGYDPEATIYTNNNFSDNAIDKGAYPNSRGFFFSLNLSF